ncbi:MAG: cytochrome b/b6 domain-containing protein [Halobacteriovoraceae bacterium]|nr:cytochrome b/b6 domain-containing protein [Halobacteriovoraceae bacterium]MCB9095686.1 cytochrome b/b6 domain-containing protein [Halobacteriovoraceae bacterium]
MEKVKVYDLPTRIFHGLFGVLFVFSFSIGKFVDDESSLYAYHMLSGMVMAFMVVLRIFWGFSGTQYARFSSFKLNIGELKEYFSKMKSGKTKRELGHNPASSFVAISMFLLTFLMVSTGYLMVNGIGKEFFKEIHEVFALSFLVLVLAHIGGVWFHQFRHNDGMLFSMVTGKKERVEGQKPISSQAGFVAVVFIAMVLSFGSYLLKSYDQQEQVLRIAGQTLLLGEKEDEHSEEHHDEEYEGREHDEDDD